MEVIWTTDAWIAMLELVIVGGGTSAVGIYIERKTEGKK